MSEDLDLCFETCVRLAKEAGKMISEAIMKEKSIEQKSGATDLVTETDTNVEMFLFENLKAVFPHHKFIGEESASDGTKSCLNDNPTWIIDPVDGTMNFVHTFPHVAVCIGLSVNKKMEVGVVYNPLLDRLFTAQRGKGSHLNGSEIKVSGETELSKALLVTEIGNTRTPELMELIFSNIKTLVPQVHGFRSLGSAALDMCSVACGEGDAYYEFGIHCWDMAAASLIITEAGGTVIDTEGGPLDMMSRRILCASSAFLAGRISRIISHIKLERD